ncbi:MAG: hypothetical protein IJ874_07225 [Ruminococcus sp.]|nr:hypothetical protein [Ruminococcus sp.]
MKRITAAAALLLAVSLSSCSSTAESESTSSQRAKRISSSPLDENLIGTWMDENHGYRFQDDRKVSLIADMSDTLHFSGNSVYFVSELDSVTDIEYDGTTLSIMFRYTDEVAQEYGISDNSSFELVTLERRDDPDPDSFDGEYSFTGGAYFENIAYTFGLEAEAMTASAVIDGESFIVTVEDYSDYEILGNFIEMFSEELEYVDETATAVRYTYSISDDGNTLTLTYDTGSTGEQTEAAAVETLRRVK